MINKVEINGHDLYLSIKKHGYTMASVGRIIGVSGQCIGQWLRRNKMPEDLYNKINGVLNKTFADPKSIGCDLDGDIFIYNGKSVYINLRAIYHEGWEACKKAILNNIQKI